MTAESEGTLSVKRAGCCFVISRTQDLVFSSFSRS